MFSSKTLNKMLRLVLCVMVMFAFVCSETDNERIELELQNYDWDINEPIPWTYINKVYSVSPNKSLEIVLIDEVLQDVLCQCYFYRNEFETKFEIEGNNTVIKVLNVTNEMSTLWQCSLKESDIYVKYLYFEISIENAKPMQMILVNGVVLPTQKEITNPDLHIKHSATYNYREGDEVDVACINPGNDTCKVQLNYDYAEALDDMFKSVSSSFRVGFRTELLSKHNMSRMICTYVCPEEPPTGVLVTFVSLKDFDEPANLKIDGITVRGTQLKQNNVSTVFIKYAYFGDKKPTVLEYTTKKDDIILKANCSSCLDLSEHVNDSYIEQRFAPTTISKAYYGANKNSLETNYTQLVEIGFVTLDAALAAQNLLQINLPVSIELYEHNTKRLMYYEYYKGEMLSLSCIKASKITPTYLDFNGTVSDRWDDRSITETMSLHVAHNNTLIECVLKQPNNSSTEISTEDAQLADIRLLLRMKDISKINLETTKISTTTKSIPLIETSTIFSNTMVPNTILLLRDSNLTTSSNFTTITSRHLIVDANHNLNTTKHTDLNTTVTKNFIPTLTTEMPINFPAPSNTTDPNTTFTTSSSPTLNIDSTMIINMVTEPNTALPSALNTGNTLTTPFNTDTNKTMTSNITATTDSNTTSILITTPLASLPPTNSNTTSVTNATTLSSTFAISLNTTTLKTTLTPMTLSNTSSTSTLATPLSTDTNKTMVSNTTTDSNTTSIVTTTSSTLLPPTNSNTTSATDLTTLSTTSKMSPYMTDPNRTTAPMTVSNTSSISALTTPLNTDTNKTTTSNTTATTDSNTTSILIATPLAPLPPTNSNTTSATDATNISSATTTSPNTATSNTTTGPTTVSNTSSTSTLATPSSIDSNTTTKSIPTTATSIPLLPTNSNTTSATNASTISSASTISPNAMTPNTTTAPMTVSNTSSISASTTPLNTDTNKTTTSNTTATTDSNTTSILIATPLAPLPPTNSNTTSATDATTISSATTTSPNTATSNTTTGPMTVSNTSSTSTLATPSSIDSNTTTISIPTTADSIPLLPTNSNTTSATNAITISSASTISPNTMTPNTTTPPMTVSNTSSTSATTSITTTVTPTLLPPTNSNKTSSTDATTLSTTPTISPNTTIPNTTISPTTASTSTLATDANIPLTTTFTSTITFLPPLSITPSTLLSTVPSGTLNIGTGTVNATGTAIDTDQNLILIVLGSAIFIVLFCIIVVLYNMKKRNRLTKSDPICNENLPPNHGDITPPAQWAFAYTNSEQNNENNQNALYAKPVPKNLRRKFISENIYSNQEEIQRSAPSEDIELDLIYIHPKRDTQNPEDVDCMYANQAMCNNTNNTPHSSNQATSADLYGQVLPKNERVQKTYVNVGNDESYYANNAGSEHV